MTASKTKFRIQTSFRIKLLILFVSIVLIVMMFPKGESLESEVTIGSVWIEDELIASKTFEILKDPEAYEKEKLAAADKVYPIFVNDETVLNNSLDSLDRYSSYLIELIDTDLNLGTVDEFANTFLDIQSYETLLQIRSRERRLSTVRNKSFADVVKISSDVLKRIYSRGLLSQHFNEIERDTISLREGKYERAIRKGTYLDPASIDSYLELYIRNNFTSNTELNSAVTTYVKHFALPNIIYSPELTKEAIENAQDKVSRNIGIVNENERIIAKHDRITPENKLKIDSYRIAKGEDTGFWGRFVQDVGKFLHILIALTLFIIYIYLFRKKIFNDNYKILLISLIILFISFLTFLTNQINVNAPIQLLIIIPAASMLFTIIFDSRVGFYGTVVIAIIAGALRGNDYVFTLMNIFSGSLAAYTVRDMKNRTQVFRSFLFILIGYIVSIVAFGLESFRSVELILINSGFAASNALLSPTFTYGLIIFIEKIFGITTELTLLELTDFNSPLLKELAKNAPGTFTHSMTIGSLVENTAQELGASPILARVGAYYHDIGKSLDPDTFVENQMDINVHEELDPSKSAELIINHVRKGIELAEKYNIPEEVIDFIPMHHGTMVVYFFYNKAKEIFGKDEIDIDSYRYPGPKPNTVETALVMLADACESTVRSMEDPSPQKIENVVSNLIEIRINDGQLDEAPLTFRDITKIKEIFTSALISQHHKRIRYPKQDEMESDGGDK